MSLKVNVNSPDAGDYHVNMDSGGLIGTPPTQLDLTSFNAGIHSNKGHGWFKILGWDLAINSMSVRINLPARRLGQSASININDVRWSGAFTLAVHASTSLYHEHCSQTPSLSAAMLLSLVCS